MTNVPRPQHLTVIDEIGMNKSMPASQTQFEWHTSTTRDDAMVVFLGLGPEPERLPEWFGLDNDTTIYFLESQDFLEQIPDWEQRVPANFERLPLDKFNAKFAANSHVVRYLPAQRAFPTFFGPFTARLTLGSKKRSRAPKTVWLPFTQEDLLGKELTIAFETKGYTVRSLDHEALGKHPGAVIPELLKEGVPDLFFSINFKGLDHFGLGFHILREAGVKVAVWMVDNPFNLMPAVKSEYWKDARLFVTDHSFIGPLIETGAKWVTHLPLAACPELFSDGGTLPDFGHDLENRCVFVGRSEFPKRKQFFAGTGIAAKDIDYITHHTTGERLDYHWWRNRLNISPLWPGNDVRRIGAGAEFSGFNWRSDCLKATPDLTVFGDDGWKDLDLRDVRPFVDYYTQLPAIYRTAAVTLNVTGMQLPAGLTQRHFDVWCAGGFLISDANPGLKIFPDELTAPISFGAPEDIAPFSVVSARKEKKNNLFATTGVS